MSKSEREAIARIINPAAWMVGPSSYGLEADDHEGFMRTWGGAARLVALDKADAILALASTPPKPADAESRAEVLAQVVGFAVGSEAAQEHAELIAGFDRDGFLTRRHHYIKDGNFGWEAYALTDAGFDYLSQIAPPELFQRCLRAHIFYLRNSAAPKPAAEDVVERATKIVAEFLPAFHRSSCYPDAMSVEINEAAKAISSRLAAANLLRTDKEPS